MAVLSNDLAQEWKVGGAPPPGIQELRAAGEGGQVDLTVNGLGGRPGMPVTFENLSRGRWQRTHAGADGLFSVTLQVEDGDRVRLSRNQDTIAYVATAGVGLQVVDVNAFYRQDHSHIESDVRGVYTGLGDSLLRLCGEPVADLGAAFLDLATLFDPEDLNPLTVVGLVGQRGFLLLRSNPESVGEVSVLAEQCTEIEGSRSISALAVLQDYRFDLDGDGKLEESESRDYVLVAHQKGGILIYDVTARPSVQLVGRIRVPGQPSQMSVDRDGRRLLVAQGGAGFSVIDLDRVPTTELLDANQDGRDDRILETVNLGGNTNAALRLVPELGLAFAGGLERGLTTVVTGHPRVSAVVRAGEGGYRTVRRLAPFGVPTAPESSTPDAPEMVGSFRVLAAFPGMLDDEVQVSIAGSVGEAGTKPVAPLQCGTAPEERPHRDLPLRRQASNPWEPGYQLFLSPEISVLADPRAAREYQRTPAESAQCTRCDQAALGVPAGAVEVLSGSSVRIELPQALRERLQSVYSSERLDAAELSLASVRWESAPSVRQEAAQNACKVGEAPGLLACSGEMTQEATDLSLRGRGFDFVLHRTYRSQTIGNGPFGPGWDHAYNRRLRELPNGDVEHYDGRGRRETFVKQPNGSLKAPTGVFATLERAGGGWLLLDAGHNSARFDGEGRLTSLSDAVKDSAATGNEMTFSYDASSRLVRVRETTGREIELEYSAECGQITRITDFAGRQWQYGYDEKQRLVSVKTPPVTTVTSLGDELGTTTEPLETRYTYEEATGSLSEVLGRRDNLVSVVDGKGQSWLRVSYGDADGDQRPDEVTAQVWGGGSLGVQYDFGARKATVTDPRGRAFAYTFTDQGQIQELTDPEGGKVTFSYDAEGLLTSRTEPSGAISTYVYDEPCSGEPLGHRRSRGNLTRTAVTPDAFGANGSSLSLETCIEYEAHSNQPIRVVDPRGTVTLFSRNEVGLALSMTQAAGTPEASTTQTAYNPAGQPVRLVNPNGHVSQMLYNPLGYPAGVVVDPDGLALTTRLETDSRGNVVSLTDPRGVSFSRTFNVLDWLTESRRAVTGSHDGASALGYVSSYFYDANGNVVEERLPFGDDGTAVTRRTYVYDDLDKLLESRVQEFPEQLFADWIETRRFYDANRNLVKVVGPEGETTEFAYDGRNLPTSVTRGVGTPDVVAEAQAYDLEGRPTVFTDGRGGVWTTSYDGYGRVRETVDPLGNKATVSYDDGGNPVVTGAYQAPSQVGGEPLLLAEKRAEHDRLNRPKALIERLWQYGPNAAVRELTTRFEYDAASNLLRTIDALGRITHKEYDRAERLVATVDAVGNRQEVEYDAAGNAVLARSIEIRPDGDPVTVTSRSTYDALGRLVSSRDGLGNEEKLLYDARNQVRFSIDEENYPTERLYDGLGRLVRAVKPEGIAIDYGYDKSSRLVSYKDALSQETTYSYDKLGRRTGVRYPDQTEESYVYDANGNLIQVTDANGNVVSQTYDAADRLTGRTVGLGSGVIGPTSESYSFDGLGRMTRAQSGSVVTDLLFDSLSRLVRETSNGKSITYEHDDVGNPTRLVYPSGYSIRQSFDALNRPTSIGKVNGTGPTAPFEEAVRYSYRGPDLVAGKTLGNGLAGARSYDAARRLLEETFRTSTGQVVFGESLAWTPRSLKSAQSRRDRNGRGQIWAYDGAGRLLQAAQSPDPLSVVPNNTVAPETSFSGLPEGFAYAYDAAQNLLSRTEKKGGVPEAVALPLDGSGRNRPASVGAVELGWDASGNLIRKGDLRLQYDYRNRLTRVAQSNGQEVATYEYDAFNRRVGRTVGTVSHETVWKGWQAAEEYTNGTLAQRRVFGLALDEIVQLQVDTNGDGNPDQNYAPLYDETGNVVAMTGENGKPVERYEYSPYGEQKVFVDSTPPVVEQVRVKGNAVWLEISEEVSTEALAEAVADQRVTLTHAGTGQPFTLQVSQPVTTGRLARRRIVLTPTSPPVAGTQVRLSVGAETLQDLFLNQPGGAFQRTFTWPGGDAVVHDEITPQIDQVTVSNGVVRVSFTEEPKPASFTAVLDGTAVTGWTLGEDRYSLIANQVLSPGSHSLTVGGVEDLAGHVLGQELAVAFSVTSEGVGLAYEAADPRRTAGSTIGNPFGFQGLPRDGETGLLYVRNRYYDPELGRFVSVDPLEYVDGPSAYAFVNNDPQNSGDPLGLGALKRVGGYLVGLGEGALRAAFAPAIMAYEDGKRLVNSSKRVIDAYKQGGVGGAIEEAKKIDSEQRAIARERLIGMIPFVNTVRQAKKIPEVCETQGDFACGRQIGNTTFSLGSDAALAYGGGQFARGKVSPAQAGGKIERGSKIGLDDLGAQPSTGAANKAPNIVYRGLTAADADAITAGRGLTAKAPGGTWTAAEHVANIGPGVGGARMNSPWISTSRRLDVARAYDSGHGVIAIDLNKVSSLQVEVWQTAPRVNGVQGLPYHRSFWAEEVTIHQQIPFEAILGPVQ